MEHAKKYILLEPDQYNGQKDNSYNHNIKEKKMTSFDDDINAILNSDFTDDEKAKKYTEILTRYRFTLIDKPQISSNDLVESEVLQSIPLEVQHKARRILRVLKENPETGWNDKGEFVYRQTPLPKSHLIELINDALKVGGQVDGPSGWQQFYAALSSSDIPKELVPNAKRWKYMQSVKNNDQRIPVNNKKNNDYKTPMQSAIVTSSSPKRKTTRKRTKSKKIDWEEY